MKIDVIHLRGRAPSRQSDLAIGQMVERTKSRGHDVSYPMDVFGSAMITRARNLSLQAVRWDSDFVLFVDDDMLPTPGALIRLCSHDKPVVSALCTTRSIPPRLAVKHYCKESGVFLAVDKYEENVLVKGPWAVGFGFVLVKTPVLKFILDYVLSAQDWLDTNRILFNRLHVRTEFRKAEADRMAAVRRKRWEEEGIAPVFQMLMQQEIQVEVGEDYHFSRMLHETNTEVWLDTGCLVGHIGEFPYSPLNLGLSHATEVKL